MRESKTFITKMAATETLYLYDSRHKIPITTDSLIEIKYIYKRRTLYLKAVNPSLYYKSTLQTYTIIQQSLRQYFTTFIINEPISILIK
ncbi:hypothetical protein SAMN04515674_10135 [Pseudarcicella hirudinis]|uniref:Uncharacterized protein n=1 Tax=Pseudarcicella hirudinis TaxID=1079859 RepID=A0A1I5M0P0_9BACT|nr:hypothetical protein SAMN04515674_10135 [Pseudarcicella hirudinis]